MITEFPKTHTFRNKPYAVEVVQRIDGVCDTDEDGPDVIMILDNKGLRGLDSALHEGLHALGIPTEYIHAENGTWDLARFLWRLGWRKK
jgi:hypothetical protein